MKAISATIIPASEYIECRKALHQFAKPVTGGDSNIVSGWDVVKYDWQGVWYDHHFSRDGMTGFIVIRGY